MTAEPRKERTPPQEYLQRERLAEARSEYWNGEIVAMAGGTRSHNRILRNLTRRLGNQLDNSPCEPFASETRVFVPECNSYFYPDALITCREAQYQDSRLETLLNPVLIAEVLSPSTEAADRRGKFDCYRTLPSLQYYLTIEASAPAIDLYARQAEGRWLYTPLRGMDAVLEIEPIGVALSFLEIYQGVEFN